MRLTIASCGGPVNPAVPPFPGLVGTSAASEGGLHPASDPSGAGATAGLDFSFLSAPPNHLILPPMLALLSFSPLPSAAPGASGTADVAGRRPIRRQQLVLNVVNVVRLSITNQEEIPKSYDKE